MQDFYFYSEEKIKIINKKEVHIILILFFSFLVGAFSMLSSIHADEVTSVKNWNELSTALKYKKLILKLLIL